MYNATGYMPSYFILPTRLISLLKGNLTAALVVSYLVMQYRYYQKVYNIEKWFFLAVSGTAKGSLQSVFPFISRSSLFRTLRELKKNGLIEIKTHLPEQTTGIKFTPHKRYVWIRIDKKIIDCYVANEEKNEEKNDSAMCSNWTHNNTLQCVQNEHIAKWQYVQNEHIAKQLYVQNEHITPHNVFKMNILPNGYMFKLNTYINNKEINTRKKKGKNNSEQSGAKLRFRAKNSSRSALPAGREKDRAGKTSPLPPNPPAPLPPLAGKSGGQQKEDKDMGRISDLITKHMNEVQEKSRKPQPLETEALRKRSAKKPSVRKALDYWYHTAIKHGYRDYVPEYSEKSFGQMRHWLDSLYVAGKTHEEICRIIENVIASWHNITANIKDDYGKPLHLDKTPTFEQYMRYRRKIDSLCAVGQSTIAAQKRRKDLPI